MEIKNTSTSYTTPQNCPHMLPCGMCKLTMMQCPRGWMYKTAWDTTSIYCGSDNITATATGTVGEK